MKDQSYNLSNMEPGVEKTNKKFLAHISWSSVFAGLVTALILQFLLSLLGLGIGMATVQPTTQQNPMEGLGTGAIIWWVLTILISLFTGGWVAGRWSDALKTSGKVFHGLLTFSLFTIISFYFLTTTIGGVLSGVGGLIGQTLTLAGRGAEEMAPIIGEQLEQRGITMETIQREIELLIEQSGVRTTTTTGGPAAENGSQDIVSAFNRYRETADQADRDALVNIVMQRTGKSRAEAEAEVSRWEAEAGRITQEVEERAREIGEDAAQGISTAAFIAFFALIVDAAAAAVGGGIAEKSIENVNKVKVS
jgi:hypothetical protein